MEDVTIIELYWQRDEKAISETDKKYGAYCRKIAQNILSSNEDCDECVNDTYLHTWNAIPPKKPDIFRVFLGKITRNISFDKYKNLKAIKRNSEMTVIMGELSECALGGNTTDEEIDYKLLGKSISDFLRTVSERDRKIFLLRYFYGYSVSDIADKLGITANNTSAILTRTRSKLRAYLKNEGFEI